MRPSVILSAYDFEVAAKRFFLFLRIGVRYKQLSNFVGFMGISSVSVTLPCRSKKFLIIILILTDRFEEESV